LDQDILFRRGKTHVRKRERVVVVVVVLVLVLVLGED
jgi:hypothetical protein